MEIELTNRSVSHTVYVLNHALIRAKIELNGGCDSIKPLKYQKNLDYMVKDLIHFGNKKNKDRGDILDTLDKLDKVKLLRDEKTSDTAFTNSLPQIDENILDDMEQLRDVIEIIIGGKITQLEQDHIEKVQRILWDFFCQVRGIPNYLEEME